ncbi:MAG: hypothetical protein KAH05_02870, partial [Clostridiales bacterium]|nr:hypothetical protein [Clostridiales bacterium]
TLYVRKTVGGVLTQDESVINNDGLYTSTGYITTLDIDRDDDVIMPKGIDWTEYDKNNVVLNMHDYRGLPVGKCSNLKETALGWLGTTEYFVNQAKDSQGFKNWEYRKAGFPMGRSIGFAPTEYAINSKYGEEFEKGWNDALKDWETQYKSAYGEKPKRAPSIIYTKSIAFEYSDVTVPANPSCVGEEEGTKGIDLIAISKGLNSNGKISIERLMEIKSKSIKEQKNQSDTISEEEMEIKEMLEAQQTIIEELKNQLKVLTDDREDKIKEAELKAEEEAKAIKLAEEQEEADKIAKEKQKLEDELNKDELDVDEFKSIITAESEKLIEAALQKMKENVEKLQDDIVRLTGSI